MLKSLILIHRYLGLVLSLILVLWCLSGFVMMYKPYPELSREQQLETLAPLDLARCCSPPAAADLMDSGFRRFQVMMTGGGPVLHLYSQRGALTTVDLTTGEPFHQVSAAEATGIARDYARRNGLGEPLLDATIENDQWTVAGLYNTHRPLYRFRAGDPAATEWYISSRSGEIVQVTTADQRLWGYLGAVIHWTYPTMLRENGPLWSKTVIWLSSLGVFLTGIGLYLGIRKLRGRRSPYRGMMMWHHYSGLIFGILTLTWLASGLFSMQPWGMFQSEGAGREDDRLRGAAITLDDINATLAELDAAPIAPGTVAVEGGNLHGELFLIGMDRDLNRQRLAADTLQPAPLTATRLESLAAAMLADTPVESVSLLHEEDAYYFSHHDEASLPVLRVIAGDAERTRYYLDPVSGDLLGKYDAAARSYRWLFLGLHRLDFTGLLRSRPLWDILMWLLMAGVTAGVATGLWLSLRRIRLGTRMVARRKQLKPATGEQT